MIGKRHVPEARALFVRDHPVRSNERNPPATGTRLFPMGAPAGAWWSAATAKRTDPLAEAGQRLPGRLPSCPNVGSRRFAPGLVMPAPRGLSRADLTGSRSPACNGAARLFSPTAALSPRGRCAPKKPGRAILRCATAARGAGRSSPRSLIAIEAAMGAGSTQQGDLTWRPSEPSRKPAMRSRARS